MPNNIDDFVEKLRIEFEAGDFAAGYEAVVACLWNDIPIPEWLKPLVEDALAWGFSAPRGKSGSMQARSDRRTAAAALARRIDRLHALRGGSIEDLCDHIYKGMGYHSAKALEQAYYRAKRAKPFRFVPDSTAD